MGNTWYSAWFFKAINRNGLKASIYFKKFSASTEIQESRFLKDWTNILQGGVRNFLEMGFVRKL